jgi:hypothetical protein
VRVRYDEGVATRIGPEPCVGGREVDGEASAGEGAGQPSSRERKTVPGADAVPIAEGNMNERANASARAARRGQRPWPVQTLLAREPGDLLPIRGARASPDRVGKARSRSRR